MIAIIDYGMGNLRSVCKGFEKVGHKAVVTRDPSTISEASHVVLPGVGAFKDCMDNLKRFKLIDSVYKAVESGQPFLGICLGLQLLFEESEEFGRHKGLGVIKGKVVKFQFRNVECGMRNFKSEIRNPKSEILKVPHMGWNSIEKRHDVPVLRDIPEGSYLYFVHSYYVIPEDEEVTTTTTSYGIEFTSSIWRDNIFACQFHPEKSQELGLRILKNFGEIKTAT